MVRVCFCVQIKFNINNLVYQLKNRCLEVLIINSTFSKKSFKIPQFLAMYSMNMSNNLRYLDGCHCFVNSNKSLLITLVQQQQQFSSCQQTANPHTPPCKQARFLRTPHALGQRLVRQTMQHFSSQLGTLNQLMSSMPGA